MLNLKNTEITEREDLKDSYVLHSRSITPERTCPVCDSITTVSIGNKLQPYIDTPMHGKTVRINFSRKRFKCKSCNKTFFEPLDWLSNDRRMTKRAESYILQRSGKFPFLQIADDLGVDEKTIRNTFATFVSEIENKHDWLAPRVLGIDETHFNKKMHLVLTNIEKKTLLDIRKDRSKDATRQAITRLKNWRNIEIVTMDMWRPYRDAVLSILPEAVIVVDRFHVAKMANEAMDKARKAVRASLDKKERIKLKGDRKILFKRRDNITELNELSSFTFWTNEYPDLMDVYNAKEGFLGMWDMPTRQDAEDYWDNWLANIPSSAKKYFSDAIRAVTNWLPYILNWWDYPYTNALTESLNNLIKSYFRSGRGYSFNVLRAKMLKQKGDLIDSSNSVPEGAIMYFTPNMFFKKLETDGISISELEKLECLSWELTPFTPCKPISKCVVIKKKYIEE